MSAWPEAVWLLREINVSLGMEEAIAALDQRLVQIENRQLFVQNTQPTNASKGSLWMKTVQ